MVRSVEATKRRAEKRKRTELEQRKVDNIDATKAIDRESDQRSSATKLEALQKAYKHAKKEYKQSDNDTTTKEERDQLKRVKSDAKKALKDAKTDDNKSQDDLQNYQQIITGLLTGTKETNHRIDPYPSTLTEPGSWVCPSCTNHNFASRHICNSKTCDVKRPADVIVPPHYNNKHNNNKRADTATSSSKESPNTSSSRRSRHDPTTSKTLIWAKQATPETTDKNQYLRKRYIDTGGEGMNDADLTRAKLLLERDERKRLKKEARNRKLEGRG